MRTYYKKGDLVVCRGTSKTIDDQTGEMINILQYSGIGIILDASQQHYGWVKIWWQKHPYEDPDKNYLTSHIKHYEYDKYKKHI